MYAAGIARSRPSYAVRGVTDSQYKDPGFESYVGDNRTQIELRQMT